MLGLVAFVVFAVAATFAISGIHGPDYAILRFFSTISNRSTFFDHAVFDLTKEMFSNVFLVTFVVYAWFSTDDEDRQAGILVGVIMSFVSGMLSRCIQVGVPSHLRPMQDPQVQFGLPQGVLPHAYNHWPSFPSDHAAVMFGLACTVYYAHRNAGLFAFALALPLNITRIYLGFHSPTDVIAGAMLGIIVVMSTHSLKSSLLVRKIMQRKAMNKGIFFALSFYFCFGVGTLFSDYRDVGAEIAHGMGVHVKPKPVDSCAGSAE